MLSFLSNEQTMEGTSSEDEPLPFTRNPIDYGLGFVKRTPDHPTMNEGVTSVVVDLVKLAR